LGRGGFYKFPLSPTLSPLVPRGEREPEHSCGSRDRASTNPSNSRLKGFTIIELLVVIVIIAILASMAIPALKGFSEANTMTAASRQMMDDIAYARQKAMNNRTTVYMVFIPPSFWNMPGAPAIASLSQESKRQLDVPLKGQSAMYALYSERSIGDQPGQLNNQYLTDWRELPDGAVIDTNKFVQSELIIDPYDTARQFPVQKFLTNYFPFPPSEITNAFPKRFPLPYIAFDSQGRLVPSSGDDEFIPLARGSVFVPVDSDGRPTLDNPDIVLPGYREPGRTNYNLVRIDRLTGRARLERMELQ
jgi:prepilin-type N-terminal cleavage/methylation domain-containing protein